MNENKFSNILHGKNTLKIAIIAGIIAVLIIFVSDIFPASSAKGQSEKTEISGKDDTAYCRELEKEIKQLVASISGDKTADVVITLENGTEYVYATTKSRDNTEKNNSINSQSNSEKSDKTNESYIIINTSGGEQPLLLSALSPTVRGVAIVCKSGEDEQTAQKIKSATSVLLDVSETKISVLGQAN